MSEGSPVEPAVPAQKQKVTFGKFQNIDLRVGRVLAAPIVQGSAPPVRQMSIDLGPLGRRTSVGQFAFVSEEELVGCNLAVCVNLGSKEVAGLPSDVLVLGARHPASPSGEAQASPLRLAADATPGSPIY
jgi:tRNA-binding protein